MEGAKQLLHLLKTQFLHEVHNLFLKAAVIDPGQMTGGGLVDEFIELLGSQSPGLSLLDKLFAAGSIERVVGHRGTLE